VEVLCIGLMLANARSLFVSLAILLLVGLVGGRLVHHKIRLAHLVSIFLTAVVMVSLAAFVFLRTEAGRDFAERSTEELASGVLNSGEDPNWQFRLSAWKEAWRRFEEYPLAGEGFGVPFTFEGLPFDNDPRPHNTFLTVLYKMGVIGFLPLLALLVYFFWSTIGAAHCNLGSRRVALLQIVVLAQLAFLLYGAANLMLESPFLAALFWATCGLGLRIVRMLNLERLLRKGAYAH
jgi:O-antigen ligase